MKKAITYILTIVTFFAGWACVALFFLLPNDSNWMILAMLGSQIILMPAFSYLHGYFKKMIE